MNAHFTAILLALTACGNNQDGGNGSVLAVQERSETTSVVQEQPQVEAARSQSEKTVEPLYFVSGESNPFLLEAIQKDVEKEIGFNHYYSIAYVDCGTGCGSYWFVDRRDGGIIGSPNQSSDNQMAEIVTKPDSNMVMVYYSLRDGTSNDCEAQSFRWTGREFKQQTEKQPAVCRQH